jgi:hypothetical protein
VIGSSVAAELDRLGVCSEVIVATLVEEVGLSAAQAREVLRSVRHDAPRDPGAAPTPTGGSVS